MNFWCFVCLLIAFSPLEASAQSTRIKKTKKKSKPFFDLFTSSAMIHHTNNVNRNKTGELTSSAEPTTIYNLGLTVRKSRVTFLGNFYASAQGSLSPRPDPIFRPSADIMVNTLNLGPLSLNATGSYFPQWAQQDDFTTIGINLAYFETLKFRSGNLTLIGNLNSELDIGQSTRFSQDLATIGLSKTSSIREINKEIFTRRIESDLILDFQPRKLRRLTLQASAHVAKSYSKPYRFDKDTKNFIQKKTDTPIWNYSYIRTGFTIRLTERLSVMEQFRYYRYDGFVGQAEDALMLQNRIYLLYTLF